MSIKYKTIGRTQCEATVDRVIKLGGSYHIAPSMGYAGVEYGLVKVVDIVSPEEYLAAPHRFPEITQHIAITATGMDKDITDLSELSDDEKAVYNDLMEEVWIKYTYISCPRPDTDVVGACYYFPISDFIEHTSWV